MSTRSNHQAPPTLAIKVFRWYCRKDRVEELEGDLEEMHELRQGRNYSKIGLVLSFWWDVFRCLKKYSVKKTKTQMNTTLYRSYVKVALRNARKNLGPVIINILGMGLSLGFCFTVYMLHAYNLEFDFFHKDSKDMHRLHSIRWFDEQPRRYELAPLPFVSKIEEEIPGIEGVTFFELQQGTIKAGNQYLNSNNDYFSQAIGSVRSNFFDYFDLPLKSGSKASLKDESTVFLTSETAEKVFGDLSPIGETITLFIGKEKGIDLQVAGVFKNIPLNTSFHFQVLVNHETILKSIGSNESSWAQRDNVAIYLQSKVPDQAEGALQDFLPEQHQRQENWKITSLEVLPFMDPSLSDDTVYYSPANHRVGASPLLVFTVLALLILLIACFNLANTAIALMSKRVREIGVRKTLGITNYQLFEQFMMEMLVISFFAFVLATAFANPISSQIFGLFGVSFLLQEVSIIRFIPFVLVFLCICTFLAGILPALYAWKFSPSSILSGKQSLKGVGWFQRMLTIGQYAVSICLLICAWTFSQNNKFLAEIDLGYNYDQIVMLPLDEAGDFERVRNDLQQLAATGQIVGTQSHHGASSSRSALATDTSDIEVRTLRISSDYLDIMEIDMAKGRSFMEGSQSDQENAIIVNQEFAFRYLQLEDPIGQQIEIDNQKRTVVGVTVDIIHSVYSEYIPRPIAYLPADKNDYQTLLIKTSANNTEDLENELRGYWSAHFDTPYRGKSQRMVSSFYATRDSRNLKIIFLSIAILGSLLSTIGIFSMAVMNVAKRTKEISIRRVLGAKVQQVMIIIYKSFSWIIGLSMIMGIAGGMFLSEVVLESIYKFFLPAPVFDSTLIGAAIMIVALLFITMAAINRVMANPSDGLRTE